MTIHDLKCWPEFFEAILQGKKNFEVRYNDRGYAVGDTLWLREYDMPTQTYTGREMHLRVTYMSATLMCIRPGWVVMAVQPFLSGDFSHDQDGAMY